MDNNEILIKVKNTYSSKELRTAHKFHYSKLLNIKRDLFVGFLFCLLAGTAIWKFGTSIFTILFFIVGLLLFLLPLVGLYILPIVKEKRTSSKDIVFEFSETGYIVEVTNSRSYTSWTKIIEVKENEERFLIYTDVNEFEILPKRFFTNFAQQSQFRSLLTAKVKSSRISSV